MKILNLRIDAKGYNNQITQEGFIKLVKDCLEKAEVDFEDVKMIQVAGDATQYEIKIKFSNGKSSFFPVVYKKKWWGRVSYSIFI